MTEPNPSAAAALDLLGTPRSRSFTIDLVADALGPSVRLEQERVSFAAVEKAIADR